jgi:mersacidin/lichenicidin family type 2 lantibiotic
MPDDKKKPSAEEIIRRWKDPKGQNSTDMPDNPAGELDIDALDEISGGAEGMTTTSGCDGSYDNRPSCGQYCTLTGECGCPW